MQDDKEVIQSGRPKRNIIGPLFNDDSRWFQTDKFPYVADSGEVVGVIGFSTEITEKRKAEISLRESEAKYRNLVETMNDGLAVQDKNNLIIYVNDALCRMTGYGKDDLVGNMSSKYLDNKNLMIVKNQMERRKQGETDPYELEMPCKNGEKIQVIISPKAILDDSDNFIGSFAVVTDITHLKEIEASLKKREKELERKKVNLEEMNAALNVLLAKRDDDKRNIENSIASNISKLIMPYIDKLKGSRDHETQAAYLGILEKNLLEITSPFSQQLSGSHFGLTPAELQVANLTRQGKSAKEIAKLLNLSTKTIEVHRHHIREKLGIRNKKVNLRSRLLALQ